MSLAIREAVEADAQNLRDLYEELTGRPCSVLESRISEIATDGRSFLFVAQSEHGVIGTVFLTFCLDPMYDDQPFAVVENVVVATARRSVGVGKALMSHVESLCVERRCSKVMLLSSVERVEAHRFFSNLGYEQNRKAAFVKYRSKLVASTF